MNTAFNLARVLRTLNHWADASQRGFTIINQVIYKQANKNKRLQYNLLPLLLAHVFRNVSVCLWCVITCQKSMFQCEIPKRRKRNIHESKCVCVCVCLWASGGGREDRWGAMGPGGGVISALFDKTESRGTGKGSAAHTQTHSAEPVLNYSARINKCVCVCVWRIPRPSPQPFWKNAEPCTLMTDTLKLILPFFFT